MLSRLVSSRRARNRLRRLRRWGERGENGLLTVQLTSIKPSKEKECKMTGPDGSKACCHLCSRKVSVEWHGLNFALPKLAGTLGHGNYVQCNPCKNEMRKKPSKKELLAAPNETSASRKRWEAKCLRKRYAFPESICGGVGVHPDSTLYESPMTGLKERPEDPHIPEVFESLYSSVNPSVYRRCYTHCRPRDLTAEKRVAT